MKSQSFSVFAVWQLLALLTVTPLFAQSPNPMRFETAFDFSVGDRALPAGEYTVSTIGSALQVRSMDNKQIATILTHSTSRPAVEEQGKLVFNRYGNTYLLSEVWRPGELTGQELSKSSQERELAQGQSSPSQTILVAETE